VEAGAGYVRVNNFYSALTSLDTLKPGQKPDSLQQATVSVTDTIPGKQDSLKNRKPDSLALKSDSLLRRDSVVTDTFRLNFQKIPWMPRFIMKPRTQQLY
jgi:hypothetical protein